MSGISERILAAGEYIVPDMKGWLWPILKHPDGRVTIGDGVAFHDILSRRTLGGNAEPKPFD